MSYRKSDEESHFDESLPLSQQSAEYFEWKLAEDEREAHRPKFSKKYVFWTCSVVAIFFLFLANIVSFYIENDTWPKNLTFVACVFLIGLFLGANWAISKHSISTTEDQRPTTPDVIQDKTDQWDAFDPDDPKYPEELDIAMQAWRAVYNSKTGGPVKEQLSNWVKKSYPEQSPASIERIATIANWAKAGGRPRQF